MNLNNDPNGQVKWLWQGATNSTIYHVENGLWVFEDNVHWLWNREAKRGEGSMQTFFRSTNPLLTLFRAVGGKASFKTELYQLGLGRHLVTWEYEECLERVKGFSMPHEQEMILTPCSDDKFTCK